MGEKAMNQMGLLSQPSYRQMQFQVQLLQIHAREIAHFYMFQVMPPALVQRTQIRCVARQCFDMKRLGCAAREVFRDGAPTMYRRTIPNRQQAFPGLTPLFETARGATRYATDLGRSMADEDSPRLTV